MLRTVAELYLYWHPLSASASALTFAFANDVHPIVSLLSVLKRGKGQAKGKGKGTSALDQSANLSSTKGLLRFPGTPQQMAVRKRLLGKPPENKGSRSEVPATDDTKPIFQAARHSRLQNQIGQIANQLEPINTIRLHST